MIGISVPALSSFRSDSGNLDIIRAVAVMSVFFAHLHEIVTGRDSLIGWHFAQMGVLTFFVHTSMVLMLSLERTKLSGKALFGSFYLRRGFRIYPLSIFCVTVAMVLKRTPEIANPTFDWTWTQYLSNLALTTNLTYSRNMVGGLWTLPLKVQMYLTLPFLFVLGRARGLGVLLLLWVLSVPAALLQSSITQRLNVMSYAPCFLAGVIAWNISLTAKRRLSGWLWPFAFMATWPFFFLATHGNDMPFRWAFCLALGLAIPWFQEIRYKPLLAVAHFFAKYSYGIYLSHVALILWTFSLPLPRAAQWAIFVPLAFFAPVAMFHWIEDPMIRVGQKVAKRIFSTASAPPASSPVIARVPEGG